VDILLFCKLERRNLNDESNEKCYHTCSSYYIRLLHKKSKSLYYLVILKKFGFDDSGIPLNVKWKDALPFVPPITRGRVIKVYDGDTITIVNYLPNTEAPLYRFSVRLLGIDCPEMKTSDSNEHKVAIIARDKLSDLILHKIVELKNVSKDKYGRILAYVWYRRINTSEWLLK